LVTIVGAATTFYFFITATAGDMPPGGTPIAFWAVPIAVVAIPFLFITAWIFERLGVRIFRGWDT
jgi:hypothetical protein